ncbi:tripartite tricarboxylate transporter permease [Aeromicrobium ponti]|uniref:Putative tricarboxylic transport membrane protein n=1 Tax=Cytobacillus oceanisediminis TaxID=665099 RepID=A0A562J4A0_9BACI|nr:tripartite tricarboxylate transporter permease [Cytobacillus oceanisediminis]TWH78028.1 putative tricarboxylic transport membrane protein [Cytobacillus oceanisediminis]
MDILLQGASELFTLKVFLFINVGLLIGIIFGSIPGLTVDLGIALFTPLTFVLDPTSAILMLLGIYCGGTYGGSITAILVKTPGTPSSVATILDGHPLAKQGKARKALDMALIASTIGGLISALVLLTTAPQIAKFTLNFGPAEYFTLAIFGLTVIAGVSGDNIIKGIIAGCLGVFVSTIGMDASSAVPRFTFGDYRLLNGVPLLIGLVGLFIVAELFIKTNENANAGGESDKESQAKLNNEGLSWSEFKQTLSTIFRSGLIGTIIGAIPGTGGGIAAFISYDQAKKRSKNGETFGSGELKGIAAPEAGNNGTTGATLIPLLTLGIPGDAATAILLGSLMIHGLLPGPSLFTDYGHIMYAIMLGLIFINIFMFLQGKILVKWFAKVAKVPYVLLVPIIAVCSVAGAFSVNNTVFDIYLILFFGIIGYIMYKMRFSPIPMLLGLVLGPIAEKNFRNAMVISDGSYLIFVTKPICIFFVVLTLMSVVMFMAKKGKSNQKTDNSINLT